MTDAFDRLKSALADRYEIERELGAGGMATVYLAHDIRHERQVAVKVLRPDLAAALGPDRFLQEIRIAAKLQHPNILPLHDSGEADGFLYYVMPYVEGHSLREKLAKEGELPIADAVRILHEVVDALAHAHEHGVVHRDIKPDNVMLSGRHALVTDFGVAKAVSEATGRQKLTTEGIALGTPAYMAPEQAAADPHIDHRADIYAVGVVAYELLTGRPPFMGTTPQMILSAHMTDTPEPVTKYRESVPPALAALVMKCLEKKAADRWQTAEELLPHLEALATPSGGVTPTGMMPVVAARRAWKVATAAGAIAVILAVVLVVKLLPSGSGVALDPDRVLVAVFENQTGDPSLDPLGTMAGNWITQGLQMSGVVQVVPWLEAQQASRYVATQSQSGTLKNPIRALAEESGAATVVSGSYYRLGDAIQFQVEVTNAVAGKALGALDPETAPLDSPEAAIEPLRRRVMGFLAVSFDDRLATDVRGVGRPPAPEAYEEFDTGMQLYLQGDYRAAAQEFQRAFAIDTTFTIPLVYAALSHLNAGQFAQGDSVIQVLNRFRDVLSAYDRHWLDYLTARTEYDHQGALVAIRRAAALAPGSKAVYNQAHLALFNNRPQEAIDALLSLDPARGPMRGWASYWSALLNAHTMLEHFEGALEVVRRAEASSVYRDNPAISLYFRAYALAGMGRVEEMNTVLDELEEVPDATRSRTYLNLILDVIRHYCQPDVAKYNAERVVRWLEARPEVEKEALVHQDNYGRALFFAGRAAEARVAFDSLVDAFPEDRVERMHRAFIAAVNGDTVQALSDAAVLEGQAERLEGYAKKVTLWWMRGVIYGALGHREQAMGLFRQFMPHWHHSAWDHVRLVFEPMRGYPPFEEFFRPKG